MKAEITKQERIIIALMRGQHIDANELEIAKQQIHVLNLIIKNQTK